MKTVSQDKIKKAQELFEVVTNRKALEKRETELKEFFKDEINDGVLEAGDILIIIEKRSRTDLDKKALKEELGKKYGDFEIPSEYKIVLVEKKSEVA